METTPREPLFDDPYAMDEENWKVLRSLLHAQARHFVNTMSITAWRGQEDELAEDIVQETIERTLERARKAANGQAVPVYALKNMMCVIAANYCKDVRRRDKRLLHMGMENEPLNVYHFQDITVDCARTAIEEVYQEEMFNRIAHTIVEFPAKQRDALLIDIANRMSFDEQPTPLQQAFVDVGIALRDYKQPLPEEPAARSRYNTSLHYAYKRLTATARTWESNLDELNYL